MNPTRKRDFITRLKNQCRIETVELDALEEAWHEIYQRKMALKSCIEERLQLIDKLEREWFYESGRVRKEAKQAPTIADYAAKFNLTEEEATLAVQKALRAKQKESS